jgi:hypothetical protein
MRHFLFIDETGEANINRPDTRFDIFALCGVLFREDHYSAFELVFKEIKRKYWGDGDVVFHSYHMRNKLDAFKIFQDPSVLSAFYEDIGRIFTTANYTVFSCIVNKQKYKREYPDKNQAYEDALMYMCERGVRMVQSYSADGRLHLCLEKRDSGKDRYLKKYYSDFIRYGNRYTSTADFQLCDDTLHFRGKHENINGLQLADLCAYPIARRVLSPEKPQPTFELFKSKIYCSPWGRQLGFGLKHIP